MIDPKRYLLSTGVASIQGPLVFVRNTTGVGLFERVQIMTQEDAPRLGRVVSIADDKVVVEVFQGTEGLSLGGSRIRFLSEPIVLDVGPSMLGRVYNGVGDPIDGGPRIIPQRRPHIDGLAINPVRRDVPREFIETGVSSIDALNSLVRGQKLPIFSGSGLSHDRLASNVARFARLRGARAEEFAVVFAAIGVTFDTAEQFRREMNEFGALGRIALFLNLASDPSAERLVTPRVALTAAEYLAYEEGHGEVPSRKGYPGYMYSDLAAIYERAGRIMGRPGSITQMPILTMPNDDITHPIPDLSGYITEGQIVLDRDLERRGIFPPIKLLPCLSRLMNHGIGDGMTHRDHPAFAQQLYSSYAQAHRLKLLSSVVGEEGLSDADRQLLHFGDRMDDEFIRQDDQRRSLEDTFDIGWRLLAELPDESLIRLSDEQITEHVAAHRHEQ